MAIENKVYVGQTFLKVKPTDRSKLIEVSKKAFEELSMRYFELMNKEKTTKEELAEIVVLTNDINEVYKSANLDPLDYTGMDHFWTLTSDDTGFNLFTIPNHKKDVLLMDRFMSIEKIFEEFRSLDDIVANSTFVGKKLHGGYGAGAYILYDFNKYILERINIRTGKFFRYHIVQLFRFYVQILKTWER